MKLFAANCSQQNQEFTYRMIEGTKSIKQSIAMGQQVSIGKPDMNQQEIDYIVGGLRRYGWREAREVSGRTEHLHFPIIYSIDKPVSLVVMNNVIDHNKGVLSMAGKTRRKEAAIASAEAIAERDIKAAQTTEVHIEEDSPGEINKGDGINETISVAGHTPRAQQRQNDRRNRR